MCVVGGQSSLLIEGDLAAEAVEVSAGLLQDLFTGCVVNGSHGLLDEFIKVSIVGPGLVGSADVGGVIYALQEGHHIRGGVSAKEALEYWIRLIVEGYCRLYHNQKWTEAGIRDVTVREEFPEFFRRRQRETAPLSSKTEYMAFTSSPVT